MATDANGCKQIHVAILSDHHQDDVICLFTKPARAQRWARAVVERYQRKYSQPLELEPDLTQSMEKSGWVYYKRLPAEVGSVRIEVVELNKER